MATRTLWQLIWSTALAGLALCAGTAVRVEAQTEEPPAGSEQAPPAEAPPAAGPTEETAEEPAESDAPLRLIYVLDEEGNLVPLLNGMTFEEVEALYRMQQELAHPRPTPRYLLQETTSTIDVVGDHAQARVEFRIHCHDDEWVRVPLGLPEMLLVGEPTYEGEGQVSFGFDEDSGGYLVWLRAPAHTEHRLILSLRSTVEQRGAERRLRFSLPPAPTSLLTVTVDSAQASLISQADAKFNEAAAPDDAHTRWTAEGLEGAVELQWRDGGVPEAESTGVLDVKTNLLVSVLSQSSLRYEAHLHVRSYGESVEKFTVSLPPGATLASTEATGYRAAVLPDATSPSGGPLVEVTLAGPTNDPIFVELVADQPVTSPDPERWLPVSGFRVTEAAQQSGTVAIAVQGDWQVRWRTAEGDTTVRRVEDLPEELTGEAIVAPFAFDRQPFLLEIRVFPRRTQTRVEPLYIVTLAERELTLDAQLVYRVREAKASVLDIEMPGWELESLGPAGVIKDGPLPSTDVQPVLVPLLQAMSGQFELELSASQPLPPGMREVSFTLPRPIANSVGAATVIVYADNQLLLSYDLDALEGWVSDVLPQGFEPREGYGEPLVFRLENPLAAAAFQANVARRARETNIKLTGRAYLGEESIEVQQSLQYSVLYERVSQLRLRLPQELQGRAIEWQLDGAALTTPLAPLGEAVAGEPRDYELTLPMPRLGTFDLTARYLLPRAAATERQQELSVPLILPAEVTSSASSEETPSEEGAGSSTAGPTAARTTITANEFVIASSATVGVQLDDPRWQRRTSGAAPGEMLLAAGTATQGAIPTPREIALLVTPLQAAPDEVRIDRLWHQTWLAGTKRRERVVFHLETPASELVIELPASATLDQAPWISVDHYSVRAAGDNNGAWVVPLAGEEGATEHVLEIMYEFPRTEGPGRLAVLAPKIQGSSGPYRMYWELVSQPGEVLVVSPAGMTDEADWHWGYLEAPLVGELPYPTRSPGWSQAEVERWIGAKPQAAPPAAANRYLLSTFDEPGELQIRTASRAQLVLLASAVVLGLGLALMYFPRLMNVKLLFAMGVLVAALGFWHPPTALQLARLAALGVGMVILARVMLSLLTWQRRPAVLGSTSADSESRRTYLGPSLDDAGSGEVTATAPAMPPPPALSPAESSR